MSLNVCTLVGRLVKELDLRYTSNGTAVGSGTIAVERPFKNQQGEKETDFINYVIWRKPAENFANFTKKGSLVGLQGSLQTRNYENQQGQRVYVTELNVDQFSFLESKSVTEERSRESGTDTNYKQNQKPVQEDPFLSSGQSIDIDDEDLPF